MAVHIACDSEKQKKIFALRAELTDHFESAHQIGLCAQAVSAA
jgi:hypothetical protein